MEWVRARRRSIDHAGGQRGDGCRVDRRVRWRRSSGLRSARAARPWAPAWWCRSRNRTEDWLSRGRADLGTFPGYCMIAPSPVSVFRLAMVLPFMHLQPCGGPRGRRKRFRRSVAQWLEHRSPNSASAIPPNSIVCHLVNVFGLKTRSQPRRHTSPFHRVLSHWVAKW